MIEARLFAYKLLDALRGDDPFWDLTGVIVPNEYGEACVRVKEDCVIAGMEEVTEFLRLLGLEFTVLRGDGDVAKAGDCVLIIRGQKPDLLKVERVVLNVLMRASGIATMTRRILERARSVNPRVRVAATRKTTPFLRYPREEGRGHWRRRPSQVQPQRCRVDKGQPHKGRWRSREGDNAG
jgi:nicotinate-nucleotide pyrophosphorylase (carboxylating)